MRRDHEVRREKQGPGVRLLREDVDRSAGEPARLECLEQRRLVDELAARGVDQPRPLLHLADRLRADHATRLVVQRQVERDEVGAGEHALERVRLDAGLPEAIGGDERVVGDHVHLQPERAPRDLLADAAETEDAERLLGELDPAPLRALPASRDERRVRLGDVAGEREQQADGVLGGRDDVRLGRVRDDDPAAGGGLDVDVVDADAGPADHLELRPPLDQLGGELRRRADDDPVVAADDLGEIALAVDVDVELGAQELDAGLARSPLGQGLSGDHSRGQP